MNVLIIGNGAREHAIAWKIAHNPRVGSIFFAPGNAGTAQLGQNIPVDPADIDGLVKAALAHNIYLTVVGPEAPLARGIVDHFVIRGMQIFGPIQAASQLESSKVFAKRFMFENNIPAALSQSFSDYEQALGYAANHTFPLVIKADGLAQGKGVIICQSYDEASRALKSIMVDKIFGDAGANVIIEEHLAGREVSAFAFSDAHSASSLVSACDYKRVYDGNCGPNTGGMGAYSPAEFFTPEFSELVSGSIIRPVVKVMHDTGRPYKGIIYAGLMLTDEGPKVLEFNVRFGDPETQVILPRLRTDLFDIMIAICDNKLHEYTLDWSPNHTVGVVLASGGYPGKYDTGFRIGGLSDVDNDIMVFHAGTRLAEPGEIVTSGGRVLTVVGEGKTLEEARQKVYDNISRITFDGAFYRRDIALVENI